MKNTIRFAAVAAVAALAVSAIAAQAAGLDFTDGQYPAAAQAASTVTRAQVSAEVQQAMAQNAMPVHQDVYEAPKAQAASSLSREQVRQEAAAAEAAGQLNFAG